MTLISAGVSARGAGRRSVGSSAAGSDDMRAAGRLRNSPSGGQRHSIGPITGQGRTLVCMGRRAGPELLESCLTCPDRSGCWTGRVNWIWTRLSRAERLCAVRRRQAAVPGLGASAGTLLGTALHSVNFELALHCHGDGWSRSFLARVDQAGILLLGRFSFPTLS